MNAIQRIDLMTDHRLEDALRIVSNLRRDLSNLVERGKRATLADHEIRIHRLEERLRRNSR